MHTEKPCVRKAWSLALEYSVWSRGWSLKMGIIIHVLLQLDVLIVIFQITSLTTLGMLIQVASGDVLETPKYKCLVSLDLIRGVAR